MSAVDGCTCGGGPGPEWHLADCGIFHLPPGQAEAAVAAARHRLREYSAERTRNLRAALAALGTEAQR